MDRNDEAHKERAAKKSKCPPKPTLFFWLGHFSENSVLAHKPEKAKRRADNCENWQKKATIDQQKGTIVQS
jgi:hypothetical protein